MGRIRSLKPDYWRSRSLARCSRDARSTFQGLWTEADSAGRGIADARVLKGAIWSMDDDITHETVEGFLVELAREHIVLYEVDGDRYYQIINWEEHQAASYRTGEAKHPAPETGTILHGESCTVHGEPCGISTVLEGKVREGKGGDTDGADPAEPAQDALPVAAKPAQPARKRDPLFDALVAACRMDYDEMTQRQRTSTATAAAQLRGVKADPDEVSARADVYRRKYPQAACTPNAIASHWAAIKPGAQPIGAPKLSKSMQAVEAVGQRLGLIQGGAG